MDDLYDWSRATGRRHCVTRLRRVCRPIFVSKVIVSVDRIRVINTHILYKNGYIRYTFKIYYIRRSGGCLDKMYKNYYPHNNIICIAESLLRARLSQL